MSSSESEGDDDRNSPPRGALARGIAVAVLCDALVSAPSMMFLPLVRPVNVAEAIEKLLFGLNMLVGYVGGRVAGRAGVAHDDGRSQWNMTAAVSVASFITSMLIFRLRVALHLVHATPAAQAASEGSSGAVELLWLAAMVLLIRFGFAMGTYSHARRAGRVQDEDEASAE